MSTYIVPYTFRWTPTLEYYTGYREDEIKPLAQRMASVGLEVLKALNRNEDTDDSFKFKGIVRKFSSVSRHAGLLQRPGRLHGLSQSWLPPLSWPEGEQ